MLPKQYYTMGCAPVKKQQAFERRETQVGVLKVMVTGVFIDQETRVEEANLKLRVSNQHFTTFALPPLGSQTGPSFSFFINSFYKPYGRSIEIGYCRDQQILCFGAFDADIILEHKTLHEFKCALCSKKTERGYVVARAEFQPLPCLDLTFRFQSALIRRKAGFFTGSYPVAVRVTIGEEILETECQEDTTQQPPVWEDKKYNFKVPQGLNRAVMEIINDKEETLAWCELNLEQMLKVKEQEEVLQSQELFQRQKDHQTVVADLKYSFIVGKNPKFLPRTEEFTSAIRGIRSRKEVESSYERPHT